jgi:hypothetical protein
MRYDHKVVSEWFGKATETEDMLNKMGREGWEHYFTGSIGPIPSRWHYFRKPVEEKK